MNRTHFNSIEKMGLIRIEILLFLLNHFLELKARRAILIILVRTNFRAMETKLTLKLNKSIIEKAKAYASDQQISLSKLVENYLNSLTSKKSNSDEITISPFVKSLTSGTTVPADHEYKKDYQDYLEEKHR